MLKLLHIVFFPFNIKLYVYYSVSWKIRQAYNVGDEITMCLMKRIKGSLLSTPVTHESPKKVCNVNTGISFLSSYLIYMFYCINYSLLYILNSVL